jgi:hypothetical protein
MANKVDFLNLSEGAEETTTTNAGLGGGGSLLETWVEGYRSVGSSSGAGDDGKVKKYEILYWY